MGESGLNRKQQKALELLIKGATRLEAAKQCGVSTRTLFRWLNDPTFSQELARAQNELWQSTISGLKSGIRRSLDYLLSVLDNELAEPKERLQAAKTLMQTAIRIIEVCELAELHERITKLESFILQERNGYDTRAEIKAG